MQAWDPSKHISNEIRRLFKKKSRPYGICIFVQSDDERDGGFMHSLIEEGHDFTHYEVDGFTWQEPYLPKMYCKDSDHVTLPATATPETIHGICTM